MALLVLDLGRALFVSEVGVLSPHQAAADALLVGLDGSFTLRLAGAVAELESCVVPARTRHALDFHGGRIACLYFEPGSRAPHELDVATLRARLLVVLAERGEHAWRALLDDAGFDPVARAVDPRVAEVAAVLASAPDENLTADALAQRVGLSGGRLEHLFARSYGVPLGAWRGWWRMRLAAEQLLEGGTLTRAAHAAGFHDSAHFSHAFRQTFGLPPSLVFNNRLEGRLIGCHPFAGSGPLLPEPGSRP
ncbi:MAG: helix-turn-helix transcriptional regulator [Deltaproteobacteria bacterium]|nr:helix-turn-helix transcriptional regulator [Nannocystaceae bacterium]